MPPPKKLRSEIAERLSPMVLEGAIVAFHTDLYFEIPPEEVVVHVVAPDAERLASVRRQVEALVKPLSRGIVVSVSLPDPGTGDAREAG